MDTESLVLATNMVMKQFHKTFEQLAMEETLDIVKYDRTNHHHKQSMQFLLYSQQMDLNLIKDLPSQGYIVYSSGLPIAAGFLRHCESTACMLDSLITNKMVKADLRDLTLNKLVIQLIKTAKEEKYTQILAISKDKNTLMRASAHGFELLPHSVIALSISGD